MAATAIVLQLRTKKIRPIRNRSFLHFFSSSTSDPNVDDQTTTTTPPPPPSQSQSQSSFSSYFSDVKASLKQQQQQSPLQRPPRKQFSPSNEKPPSKVASFEEIRKNLSEFRHRSAVPPPSSQPPPPSSQQISFQELYKQNVISKGDQPRNEPTKGGKISFDAIRESLRTIRAKNLTETGGKGNDKMSLSGFTSSFKLRPRDPNASESPVVFGGGPNQLPSSVFGREIGEKKLEQSDSMKTEFIRMYSYVELGEKLRKLRPETKGDTWFSFGELNDRLMKLRELEQRENELRISGVLFQDLRESLVKLRISEDEKTKKSIIQRLDVLSQLGGTPNFMLSPPKENLVEVYFHPDNMSSSEKMKLELKKVRDEFKMSETDCGSARVQVAQITMKIKHLSTALHKKDKHSQKGLKGMVERRKKLLKYLRRTDWDSYCLVLSKLGLRDNTETTKDRYRNLNEKKGKNKKKKKKKKKNKLKT